MAKKLISGRTAVLASVALVALGFQAAEASPRYGLIAKIPIPATPDNNVGGKFVTYDITDVDQVTNRVYLADRSNAAVDVFNGLTNTFITQIGGTGHLFSGQTASNGTSGPDGVQVAKSATVNQLFVGNGDSTLKAFDLGTYTQVGNTVTGTLAAHRVDELAFDPTRNVVVAVNNDAPTPFVSLVDATTHLVTTKITFDGTGGTPNATGGLEAPAYDPATDKYYVSVPEIGGGGPGGVSEINPTTGTVSRTFDFASFGVGACSPTGLVPGLGGKLLVGCGSGGNTILLDPTGAGSVQVITGVGGEDQVAYDPSNGLYFTASRNNPGGPVLGVIDAATATVLQLLPTTFNDHSVMVDFNNNEVFVPFGADASNTICPNGCMAVFAEVPEPPSLALLLSAALGMVGMIGWRWRR